MHSLNWDWDSDKLAQLWPSAQCEVYMSLVVRKSFFRVSDQVPHKPGCTVTEDG